jgi:hypothetical protein
MMSRYILSISADDGIGGGVGIGRGRGGPAVIRQTLGVEIRCASECDFLRGICADSEGRGEERSLAEFVEFRAFVLVLVW